VTVHDVHVLSLARSTALSTYYIPHFKAPLDIIRILNETRVQFVLIGTHALGGWMNKPRTTHDVDVLVTARGHKKAVNALLAAFPDLEAEGNDDVTQLRHLETQAVLIDLMKPNRPLFREALKHTHTVQTDGQEYQIPSLEMALTMKFAPLISESRAQADRFQDAHDFMCIIKSKPEIDLRQLAIFGELVYNGGGAEIVEMVRKVRAGEKLIL
jgi:predicted nucleotidyltransferase